MSLFTRPSTFVAIIFGFFAILIPRVLYPLFRPTSTPLPTPYIDERFQRESSAVSDTDEVFSSNSNDNHVNIESSQSNIHSQHQLPIDQNGSKSNISFAIPMYSVGIAVFLFYTCFKYWGKRNDQENRIRHRYSSENIRWNNEQKKFKYHVDNNNIADDEDNDDSYAGLDPEYVEYLKLRRKNEFEGQQKTVSEQRQMQQALDEMKSSLSFINSKLGKTQTGNNLTYHEISQLQDRLAATETYMSQILNAINLASNKVNELTKLAQASEQNLNNEEECNLSSRSHNEIENSEDDVDDEEESENDSDPQEQVLTNKREEDSSSSSSYEEDEESQHETEDDESESDSERYGLMNTNYGSDPILVDDYELNNITKTDSIDDSRTKVQAWRQRNHSQSLSTSHSSLEQDQAITVEEENPVVTE